MHESANKLLPFAKVIKSFGTDGGVIIRFASRAQDKINKKRPVFIYFDGLPVPFFIIEIEPRGTDKAFVKMQNIDSLELSMEIEGELLYLEEKKTEKSAKRKDDFNPTDLIGMLVMNSSGGLTGEIVNFYDYPGNPCIGLKRVNTDKEALIPLHEDFILSIEFEKGKIVLDLPAGILDI